MATNLSPADEGVRNSNALQHRFYDPYTADRSIADSFSNTNMATSAANIVAHHAPFRHSGESYDSSANSRTPSIESINKCVEEVERRRAKEKPHSCTLCSRRYVNSAGLIVHMLTHREQQQNKLFTCTVCKQAFSSSQLLKQHEIVHHGQLALPGHENQCTICLKSFSYKSGLLQHMQEHDENRQFICRICGKSFTTRANLNSHILSHSYEEKMAILDTSSRPSEAPNTSPKVNTSQSMNNSGQGSHPDGPYGFLASGNSNQPEQIVGAMRSASSVFHALSAGFLNFNANVQRSPETGNAMSDSSGKTARGDTPIDVETDVKDEHNQSGNKDYPPFAPTNQKVVSQSNSLVPFDQFHMANKQREMNFAENIALFSQKQLLPPFSAPPSGAPVSEHLQYRSRDQIHDHLRRASTSHQQTSQHLVQNQSGVGSQDSGRGTSNQVSSTTNESSDCIYPMVGPGGLMKKDPRGRKRKGEDDGKERPFACNFCDKRFIQKTHLNVHILGHTGVKPHACHLCDKRFTQKSGLEQHILTHTGERPHVCPLCDRTFTQKSGLNNHILSHSGERPHLCPLCDRTFTQKSGLNNHILSHSGERPHVCPLCDRTFTQKSGLNNHILSHSGEKRFECRLCGRRFKQKANLNTHILTHTGERPHHCQICDKRFTQKGALVQHIQQQHCNDPSLQQALSPLS